MLCLATIVALVVLLVANRYYGELLLREYAAERLLTTDDLFSLDQLEQRHSEIHHANGEVGGVAILVVAERGFSKHVKPILERWGEECVPPFKVTGQVEGE